MMMICLCITQCDTFKRALQALLNISREATLHFSPESISLMVVEPEGFLISRLYIAPRHSDEYICKEKGFVDVDLTHVLEALQTREEIESIFFEGFILEDKLDVTLIMDGGSVVTREIGLFKTCSYHLDMCKILKLESKMRVILSQEAFRSTFHNIKLSMGNMQTAFVTVKTDGIEFAVGSKNFCIQTKEGVCQIKGLKNDNRRKFILSLARVDMYVQVSRISNYVVVLKHSRKELPPIICYKLGIGRLEIHCW